MRKRKPKAKVVSGNYMDKIPHISEGHEWRELDDGNVEVDMPHKGFYAKIAQKFFHKPAVSHIKLDEYGSVVWKSIDGERTIYDIVGKMNEAFPEEENDMLKRVITFISTLEMNKFGVLK